MTRLGTSFRIVNQFEGRPRAFGIFGKLSEKYDEILGVKTPLIRIPVKPGRNIPILVETAFISNPEEEKKLSSADFQVKLAGAIVDGIVKFFNTQFSKK